jgi:hypothetical protein
MRKCNVPLLVYCISSAPGFDPRYEEKVVPHYRRFLFSTSRNADNEHLRIIRGIDGWDVNVKCSSNLCSYLRITFFTVANRLRR